MIKPVFFSGLDLGQRQDFTAFCVVQRYEVVGAMDPVYFARRKHIELHVRHLERIPLNTPYTEVVERAKRLMAAPELAGRSELIPDATGVGRPVMDMLLGARLPFRISPVVITAGLKATQSDGYHHVPKRDLIAGVQLALENGALKIGAAVPFREALLKEMTEMRVEITPAGNERFGSWRNGSHDDLVLAVALACWGARKQYPVDATGRPQYFEYRVRVPAKTWPA